MKLTASWLSSPASRAVTDMLTNAGYEAYFVGGCVRNALVGMPVSDLDLSTNARPEQVIALAEAAGLKAVPTGIDHGTVTVVSSGEPYEITTFRKDVETDGRRAVVAFADRLEDDARRRDFTMNALYCAPDGTVVDPVHGLPDLKARLVRFIDDANARIQEDYLRILRFFRFYAWFGDPETGLDADGLAACASNLDGLSSLSKERVGAELLKTLAAPDPAPAMAAMSMSGVLVRLLPGAEVSALAPMVHLEGTAGFAPDPICRLAALGLSNLSELLRLSKAEMNRMAQIRTGALSDMAPAHLGYKFGSNTAQNAVLLRAALMGQSLQQADLTAAVEGAEQIYPVVAADLMPDLQGPALGARLKELEAAWIASDFSLTKQELLALP